MRYDMDVNGRARQVTVVRVPGADSLFAVSVDGRSWQVDAVRVNEQTLSLLVRGVDAAPPERAGGASHEVVLVPDGSSGRLEVRVDGARISAAANGGRQWGRKEGVLQTGDGPQRVVAPMPGKIVRVLVKPGEAVRARQSLIVIEAMKMENELRAGRDGTVADIRVREGTSVDAGALLVIVQ